MVTNEFLNQLPMVPGIYIMKNKNDKVIYVGKAKVLKNRVKQYFINSSSHTPKVSAMVSNVDHIEYIVTNSEAEALNLECSFIKKYRPKYNILLKDDKTYPYIKITDEEYPRLLMVRRKENDNGKYFGPYVNILAVKTLIDNLKKLFQLRDCNTLDLRSKNKVCLNYHIGRCMGPCTNDCKDKYKENIKQATQVLNGDFKLLINKLYDEMNKASDMLNFETAAEYRDRINAVKKIEQKQIVVTADTVDEDYIAVCRDNDYVCVQQLMVRNGKLIDKHSFFMQNCKDEPDFEILTAFITQYYTDTDIPKFIYTSADVDAEVAERLSELKNKKVTVKMPKIGDKANFIRMAELNGLEAIKVKELELKKTSNTEAVIQLQQLLELNVLPVRIEAYDISNTNGMETVASMVVFTDGLSDKKEYRKFKIKHSGKSDDYGSMREVFYRRFQRLLQNDEKFSKKPDLIFVDGGKGQISSAKEILKEMNIDVPVYGIVKDDKHRTRDIISSDKEYNVPLGSKCFKLAVNIQDEMHRVAITYHKTLRDNKNLRSSLLNIPGVGKTVCKILLKEFKTVERIKNATFDELNNIKGINKTTAQNICDYFKNS